VESSALFVAKSFFDIALRERRSSEDKAKDTFLLTSLLLLKRDYMLFQRIEPSNGSPAPMLGRVSWRTLAAMAVAFLPLFAPARVKADLSAISGDTIFGTNITFGPSNGVTVNGTVAVGPGGHLNGGGTGSGTSGMNGLVINNPSGVALDLAGTTSTVSGIKSVSGAITSNDSNLAGQTGMNGFIQQASTAFAKLGVTTGAGGTTTSGLISGVVAGGITITGNGGLNVVDVNSFQGGGVVLKGGSNDIFVINVTSLTGINGGVTLMNGVTANHVLFNIENTSGSAVQLSGILNGTFLAPSVAVTLSGASSPFTGAILDGSIVTMDIDETSSPLTMNGAAFTDFGLIAAPEPAPLVKAISGLATIGIWGFFRRKRSKSK
jgi:hypothetical protein